MKYTASLLALAFSLLLPPATHAQVDARLLRYPDVSETHVTFVYGGDIWVAPKEGGTAHRLSSPKGEEMFPRFSPDGTRIAFSGNYDGNPDVYTIPTMGGTPTRVTHHPEMDMLLDWYPAGDSLLYATDMASGRERYSQLYRTTPTGGLPQKLPVPYGEFGAISPDEQRIAFTRKSRVFRTWKRYRGGMAPEIWVFDLQTNEATNVTQSAANDEMPMWDGQTLYFLSDRGPNRRYNIWAYDLDSEETRQVTQFTEFDVHFPAIGPSEIVFEAGGQLHLMDLETEETRPINIDVVTDRTAIKPRTENVGSMLQSAWISPNGKRAVVQARGELFSVPAEHGPIRNLTRTAGVAERYPAWSPTGDQIAYFSDRSGEYELTVQNTDGSGEETTLTSLGAGFRYQPYWSPDGEKAAFIDQAMRIQVHNTETGETTTIDEGQWMYHGALSNFSVSWSSDSRWIAYDRGLDNRHDAIFLYDTENDERHQVTSGYYNDSDPVFDPNGDYLYLQTDRNFDPVYSGVDNTFVYPNMTKLAAIPLRNNVDSPLAPRNDEVETDDGENGADESGDDQAANGDEESDAVTVDLDGFEQRLVELPPKPGRYTNLQAAAGKLVYRRLPRAGSGDEQSPIVYYDVEAREEKTVLDDADGYRLSANGQKLLVVQRGRLAIVDLQPGQNIEQPLRTDEMQMTLDPRAEWQQIFTDAWRMQRDYFYDPNMHGVDWNAIREQYGALVDDAASRVDINFLIGEMIAELNASHTYRGGGDMEQPEQRGVGLLGVDWSLENGAYRIERIIDGAPWDSETRSSLRRPGINVSEGDYVLAVNGTPLDTNQDPWAALGGLAGETVALTINDQPSVDGAREVLVETMESDDRLRYLDWIESSRQYVEEQSDGRVGYVYVPNTGIGGQTELVRQFRAQFNKDALIIDERFNSGGQIPDRFIELLNRPAKAFWAVRHGQDWQWPPIAHFGPKTMLINGWSGSGGDAFPDYFRKANLGPLIGTRTWGGLIGITGAPPLIDRGGVTVPTFRMYNPDGTWFDEGHGVEPNIRVVDHPGQMARGQRPQLDRAIQEMMQALETYTPVKPERPSYETRVPEQRR